MNEFNFISTKQYLTMYYISLLISLRDLRLLYLIVTFMTLIRATRIVSLLDGQ